MELIITERQFKNLISNSTRMMIVEDEDPVAATAAADAQPVTGASEKQKGAQGYPEVTTWASLNKITRGPANQLGNTKWSETVGVNLNRGLANQLKEQGIPAPYLTPDQAKGFVKEAGEFLKQYGPLIAQIGAGIIATVATGGATLWWQAIAQAGVQLPFSLYELIAKKDYYGAALSFAIACIPIAGRLGRIGSRIDFVALNKMRPALETLKTPEEIAKYLARISNTRGGVALKNFINMAPGEIEKITNGAFVQGLKNNVNLLPKVKPAQRLMLKDLGFNLTGMAGTIFAGQKYVKPAIEKKLIGGTNIAGQAIKSYQRSPLTPERQKEIEDYLNK